LVPILCTPLLTQATNPQELAPPPLVVTIFIEPPITRFQYVTSEPEPLLALKIYLHCPEDNHVLPTPFLKPNNGPNPYLTGFPYWSLDGVLTVVTRRRIALARAFSLP